jgi:predicted TIM-barrel fold metal-dependent hydrolase
MLHVRARLADMDRIGIDVAVVSLPPIGLLPDQLVARDLIAAANDGILALCAEYPDRFVAMATLPFPDASSALTELERLSDQSALRGVTFPSQATLHRPDQIGMEPVLARAAEMGLVTMIHPSGASIELGTVFEDFGLGLAMHAMVSGPLAVLRMIAAGFFDRVPDLEIILPNFGGVMPFLGARFDDRLTGSMSKRPTEYMRRNIFFDTTGFPAGPAFRCTLEAVGNSQVVFGTDYPSWEMQPLWDAVAGMELPGSDRRAILGGNAARWFDPRAPRLRR